MVKMMKDEPSIWEDARKIPLQRDPEGGTALRAQSAVNQAAGKRRGRSRSKRDPEGGTALRAQSAVNDEKVKSGS